MIKQRAIPMKYCLCELTDLYWIPVCLVQTRIECIKKKKKLYPHPCRVNTHLYHSSYQTMHIYIYNKTSPSLFIQTLIHSNIYRIYRKLFFILFKKIQFNNDDNKIRLNYIFNLTNKLSIFFTRFNFSVYSTIYISKEGYINVPYILRLIINIIRNSPNIINALCPALKRERTVSERKRDTSIRDSIFRDANSVDGAPTVFIEFVVNRVLCTMYELEAYREYKWPRVHVDRWRARAGSLLSLVKATLVKSASTCLAK